MNKTFTTALKLISSNLNNTNFLMTACGTNCREIPFEDERGALLFCGYISHTKVLQISGGENGIEEPEYQ